MLQESNRIEFKVELNDKLEKEVVAFLNNKEGGILYIGVDDNGKPVGVSDIDSAQLKIADRIKNNILPSTLCQTAHCGRGKSHFIFGGLASPIVPYRNLTQTTDGIKADCRSLV